MTARFHRYTALIMLAAGLALTSCKKEVVPCEDSGIRFVVATSETATGSRATNASTNASTKTTATNASTRATVTTTSTLNAAGKSFTVDAFLESAGRPSGYNADPHYIKTKTVSWSATDSGQWTSTCNWVNSVYTNFWSRYPASAPSLTFPGNGKSDFQQKTCSFTYDMPASGSTTYAQTYCTDLLYAYSRKCIDLTGSDRALRVGFGHVLSAICFTQNLRSDLDIVSMSIKGIYGQATCTLTGVPSVSGDNGGDTFTASWSGHTDLETSGYSQTVTKADLTDGQMSISGSKLFILIPQALTSEAKVTVTFKDNGTSRTFTSTASLGSVTWEPGLKYTYNITFTGSRMTVELDDASVRPWDEIDGGSLDADRQNP